MNLTKRDMVINLPYLNESKEKSYGILATRTTIRTYSIVEEAAALWHEALQIDVKLKSYSILYQFQC
jgi:hypothetical protein